MNSILVVEDSAKFSKLIKECLQEEGYTVSIESRGDKAVYRIIREQPALVVLDIMLPGMNGDQICHTVRDEYPGKILMLTALNDIESEVSSLNLGADDYLTKPVAGKVLVARIEALLRRPSLVHKQHEFKFGQLIVNLSTKSVYLMDKEVPISSRDFEVLGLLVKNHDRLLSRNSIMYALHGREYDGVERTIDLIISRLRKALNDNSQQPYRIKTIHKKGYIFVSEAWK